MINILTLFRPIAILPSPGQFTIAVRCCPVLFELRPDGQDPIISLPYRMVIAVATRSSVVLYDTQQLTPFAVISNIHYTRLTDLTWSQDGLVLVVSSTDGFCSLVTFEPNELGQVYTKKENVEEVVEEEEKVVEPAKEEKIEAKKEEKKQPSFLKQWATKNVDNKTENIIKERDTNIILIDDSPKKDKTASVSPNSAKSEPENFNSSASKTAKPIAVRRKPKDSSADSPKLETVAKPIAIRRKPKDSNTDSPKLDTVAKPIEIRRKPKDTNTDSPKLETVAKPIEVQRKPKDTDSPKVETDAKPIDALDVANAEAKPIAVKRKLKEEETASTSNSGAKPIAIRKKPRDQMDITKFFTSPNEPPAKKITTEHKTPRISLFSDDKSAKEKDNLAKESKKKEQSSSKNKKEPDTVISDDCAAQDGWKCGGKMETDEAVKDFILIEDSQDMKLFIEDTQKGSCESQNEIEKSKLQATVVDKTKCRNTDKNITEEIIEISDGVDENIAESDVNSEKNKKPEEKCLNVTQESKSVQESTDNETGNKGNVETNLKNTKSLAKSDITEESSNKSKSRTSKKCITEKKTESENTESNESSNKIIENLETTTQTDKLEETSIPINSLTHETDNKNTTQSSEECVEKKMECDENPETSTKNYKKSEEKSSALTEIKTKINELQLQSPVHKKKVPFITLSSPKNKKNKS